MRPLEALNHEWILEGLPKNVLVHHQRMLGMDVQASDSEAQQQELDEIEYFDEEEYY